MLQGYDTWQLPGMLFRRPGVVENSSLEEDKRLVVALAVRWTGRAEPLRAALIRGEMQKLAGLSPEIRLRPQMWTTICYI